MLLDLIGEGVAELARASAQRAQKRRSLCTGVRRWRCMRAGVDTPLWDALAGAVEAQLKRRGARSRLARFLGISRQRLHLLIVAKTAYPDAERALLLQLWLQARLQNRDLVVPVGATPKSIMSSIK